jgi:hypothetical protein
VACLIRMKLGLTGKYRVFAVSVAKSATLPAWGITLQPGLLSDKVVLRGVLRVEALAPRVRRSTFCVPDPF